MLQLVLTSQKLEDIIQSEIRMYLLVLDLKLVSVRGRRDSTPRLFLLPRNTLKVIMEATNQKAVEGLPNFKTGKSATLLGIGPMSPNLLQAALNLVALRFSSDVYCISKPG